MRNWGHRFLAIFLCVTIAVSCLTVTGSAFSKEDAAEFIMDILSMSGALEKFAKATEYNAADEVMSNVYQDVTGRAHRYNIVKPINLAASYTQVMKANLNFLVQDWNFTYSNYNGISWTVRTALMNINGEPCWVIVINVPRSEFVVNTGYDTWLLCDGLGNVLFATMDDSAPSSNHWVSKSAIGSHYYLLSYEDLNNLALSESGNLARYGDYFVIMDSTGSHVLVNPDGYPYAAIARGESAAVNQDRPTSSGTVTDSAGNVTNINGDMDYSTNIDMNGGTVTFPDGVVEQLNSVIYDQSTKTYFVDSRDFSTTYNQSFSFFQYHINYTSVTYIGQTEEYNKYYEAYYELPDGRDSADLTKEDLEQLNISIDVIPYGRSSDNTSLRSLYHFDGDTHDASYWNYLTSFTWNKGASLTYMDAATFNGALYLDETEHDFTMKLPSRLASADFTLQFRYYQSYTAAPQTDSWIQLSDTKVMQFNGGSFLTGSGTVLAATPIGTWNELALIRDSGTMYYYLNGVCIGSVADLSIYTDEITFHFGDDQQTYKYFDELRVLNYALQTGGANYECSAVPHDTNLSLVLPDSQLPVADEYWSFVNDQENLIDPKYANAYVWTADTFDLLTVTGYTGNLQRLFDGKTSVYPSFRMSSTFTTLVNDGSSSYFVAATSATKANASVYNKSGSYLGTSYNTGGPFVPIVGIFSDVNVHNSYNLPSGTYTLSLVNVAGEISSVTFDVVQSSAGTEVLSNAFGYEFGYYYESFWVDDTEETTNTHVSYIGVVPTSSTPDGLVYMELVKGSETHLTAEWVESVTIFDKDDLNTPSLAVRTDIEISSHQIGGVRPSVPSKGQVWALVERNVITSLQIYTGTAWENVEGRIWTGSRWIPASSYNVITLQDMYDIADATPDYEYIYTESGFWDWWQRSWTDFVDRLFGEEGSGSTAASSVVMNEILPGEEDNPETEEDESWSVLDLIVVVKDGVWSVVKGVVSTGFGSFSSFKTGVVQVGSFFSAFSPHSSSNVLGLYNYGGDDIWA